jgi:amidohydrolase
MEAKLLVEKYLSEAVSCRRWLHQHAEIAWSEHETTDYIEESLRKTGLEPHRFDCGTGCWALIKGGKAEPGAKTILLRADIDAMPGTDVKDVPYKSIHDGAVHSCGHDAHTAMLLCAAKALVDIQEELTGNVKLVFEPAEELAQGGDYCVSQGVMENVDAAFAIHMWDTVDEGRISIKEGPCMAGFCAFKITVSGESNTMYPHEGGHVMLAAAKIIENLEAIKICFTDSFEEPTDITLGKIHGGFARNTMVDLIEIEGVVRTFYKRDRKLLADKIKQIAENTAEICNCTADVVVELGLPAISHDNKAMNRLTQDAVIKILGENALQDERASIGGDTFVNYMSVPGAYARLGTRVPENPAYCYSLHNDSYNMRDETVLPSGTAIFVQVVLDYFESKKL